MRPVVYVRLTTRTEPADQSLKFERQFARDHYELAVKCQGVGSGIVGGTVVGVNPTLVKLKTLKTQLIEEFFSRGVMSSYESPPTARQFAPKIEVERFVSIAAQISTEVETVLQRRDDPDALINQTRIYAYANALLNSGNTRIGIDPMKLTGYLAEIDAEVLAEEQRPINF